MKKTVIALLTTIALLAVSIQAKAAIMGYIGDKAGFDTAVAGLSGVSTNVLDFESQAAGSVVAEGGTIDGLTFNSNLPNPFEMGIRGIGGTSGLNTLATTGDNGATFGLFGLSDTLDVTFGSSHAFGFYLVVSSNFDFFADDVLLTFGGTTIALDGSEVSSLVNGVDALWIGMVDDSAAHTSAKVQFGQGPQSFLAIGEFDDITTTRGTITPPNPNPVSEPATVLLFLAGLMGLFYLSSRRLS